MRYILNGQEIPFGPFQINGVSYPANVLVLWTDEELDQIGLERVPDPEPEPMSLSQLKTQKIDQIREIRQFHELKGITVGGAPIRTDDKSQSKLTGAVTYLTLAPSVETINWEAIPGVFVALTREQIMGTGLAVGAHIQACFDRSKELTISINAAPTIQDVNAIDITSGWPSGT
jgi:hypothetical protein